MSNLSYSVNPVSLADVKAKLNYFTIAVQDKIVRKAARRFARDEIAAIAPKNGQTLPPYDLKHKVKIFRSGVVWIAVGYRTGRGNFPGEVGGRARRKLYDAEGTGWRSHFTELGFHAWPRGAVFGRSEEQRASLGKGWKRGLRHRGRGIYKRGTRASELTHYMMGPRLLKYLSEELAEQIVRANGNSKGLTAA